MMFRLTMKVRKKSLREGRILNIDLLTTKNQLVNNSGEVKKRANECGLRSLWL